MNVNALFNDFGQRRILVVGDVMIDAYMRGTVSRISPEAPVPIVNLKKVEDRLGGAANVALNLLALGAEPVLCAVIGDDDGGKTFFDLLDKRGLTTEGIVKSNDRQTTIKTRVIGDNQQLLRIDQEELTPINSNQQESLIQRIDSIIANGIDGIILEDYNKGLLTPEVIRSVISIANQHGIPVTVDPKKDNFFAYEGVTLFKPNLKELREGLGVDFDIADRAMFEQAVDQLESRLGNQMTFVTLSEHGVFIKKDQSKHYIPAHIRNIADVSGAGDTVIAVATLCLVAGLHPSELADIANLAGGLVCEVSGVVPVDKQLLMEEVSKLIEA